MNQAYSTSSRRVDVYDKAGVYQLTGIRPGFLTKMLIAGLPNLMGCFGKLHGCMQCFIYRSTLRLNTMLCAGGCIDGMGTFCTAAGAAAVKKYWSTFSVVCSELFRQVSSPPH
jgi:hypothetical protein